ncbi:MAG: FtsW/RodA/SpoVE family cell cycle protein [Candidatus Paceibacterota bacterium]|jgi:cell division protein FtsW
MRGASFDKIFIGIVLTLLVTGMFAFWSASLGILAKSEAIFFNMISSQFLLGVCGGLVAFVFFALTPYKKWKKFALPILIFSSITAALVFVNGIGFEHGGAKRWIHVFGFSLQPSEFLKFGIIIYAAAWYSWVKNRVINWRYGLLPFLLLIGLAAALIITEPDTGTFLVLSAGVFSIYLAAGAPTKHVVIMILLGLVAFTGLVSARPYLMDRITTFMNPSSDPLGSSYQIQQSLVAIGSGGITGRGYGQSVQKFNFLPEPVGDSIFAVWSEEFGFIGSVIFVLLFLSFTLRGLRIANTANDNFGKFLATGFVVMISVESFLNIAALTGIVPLTGVPLIFVSQGGTALLFALAEVGIVANISRFSA